MDLLMQDVRYAVRRLAASPLFAVMAILIVGVGIAANTTVFSVIVGVVKDVKVASLTEEPRPQFYRPLDQQGGFVVSYIVRSTGDQTAMAGTLSRVVREVAPLV